MLIRFTLENFRSFYEEATFSMYPGRMQSHSKHIIQHGQNDIDVLRIGLLYGANASGKSNLIKAMAFAHNIILEGVKAKHRIPVEPFKLKKSAASQASRFEFEFISQGQAYAYGFSLDSQRIHDEWLYLMYKQSEKALFERTTTAKNETAVSFPHPKLLKTDDSQFLQFVARSTRPNQLFLSQSIENNVPDFEPAFDWFKDTLTLIFPESRVFGLQARIQQDENFSTLLADFLSRMGTGVDEVCLYPTEVDKSGLPAALIAEISDELSQHDEDGRAILNDSRGGRYLVRLNEQHQVTIDALGTIRKTETGEKIMFDMLEESDGTQRLFDLFPIIHSAKQKVFIIDELERSLHPNLVRRFIDYVLQNQTNNQLIVSTHEATLLDLELLRRDEIWFVEKTPTGNSTLYSLEEFKPRKDLDIRKGYLQGRFGAIPILGSSLVAPPVEATTDAA